MHGDLPRDLLTGFYAQLLHDLSSGAPRSVEDYVALYPQHADLLRAEYLTLLEQAVAEQARATPSSGASPGSEHPDSPSMQLVRVLDAQQAQHGHYARREEIARGGMGSILEVWDEHLRRALAMKVMLRAGARAEAMFIEEAQVTGRLDHPGIVPVHELGMGSDGRLYFTMRLVKGQTLKSVIDLIHEGDAEWTQTRVLDVLLKVCDAMAYAHSKNVVHRDLKPANVMVGRFGEVYVMDWGLARVLGTRDRHDLRLRMPSLPAESSIHTLRDEDREETPDSPLITMDGEVMGTPAYMPPEQADGRVDELGPRSDVYAVGAMLYHVLTGRVPYTPSTGRASSRTILAMLLMGPPHPVQAQAPSAPAELVAICEKAMSRDPARRYADMQEMAADLRAYVEHRVVRAYETGAMAESKKWLRRNPGLAAALGSVFVLAIAVAVVQAKGRREADREREIALAYAARVGVLSDTAVVDRLERESQALWPIHPRTVPALERWLADAQQVVERARTYAAGLAALRARALPYTEEDARLDAEKDPLREKLEDFENGRKLRLATLARHPEGSAWRQRAQEGVDAWDVLIAELKPRVGLRHTWRFSDPVDQQDHEALARLAAGLEELTASDPKRGRLIDVQQRLERSRTLAARTLDDHRATWAAASAAIADRVASPAYGGLVLAPQVGLVPIGRDPESGFFEFAVPETGDVVQRGADGRLDLTERMSVVLVLVPGGKFDLGSQKKDRDAPAYDAFAQENESPVRTLQLHPFFVSKYELTQAQWERLCGTRPSAYDALSMAAGPLLSLRHPVENISWTEARDVLARVDLLLPTEAQWEYCARAGTTTPYFTGDTPDTLAGFANLPDKTAIDLGQDWAKGSAWREIEDGYPFHAPVGTYWPNAFGLHDTCGNVAERCRDGSGDYALACDPRDGLRDARGSRMRVVRGGAYADGPDGQRSAKRHFEQPSKLENTTGVRPARRIDD